MVLTAAGAVNLEDASDCRRNANKFRQDANTRRDEARRLRARKEELTRQMEAIMSDISTLDSFVGNNILLLCILFDLLV